MITFLRVVASFAIVGVLLWVFTRASAGRLGSLITGGSKGKSSDPLHIVDRRQLTKSSGLAIVRAGERHLLVGVSDAGVQLLAEGEDLVPPEAEEPIDLENLDGQLDTAPVGLGRQRSEHGSARTRLRRDDTPRPPRMSLLTSLREMTVRRS